MDIQIPPEFIAELLTEDINVNNGLLLEASWDPDLTEKFLTGSARKWLAKFGIEGDYELVGEGGSGRVYKFGDKVVKITSNEDDATISHAAINRCKHSNLVNIYGVARVPKTHTDKLGRERTFYLIVMDLVETRPLEGTPLGIAADMVGGHFDVSGERPPFIPAAVTKDVIDYQDEEVPEDVRAYIMQLLEIVNDIYKHCGLRYIDVGATNIGFHDGEIVLIDLGLSEFKD